MPRVQVLGENSFPFHAVDEKRPQFEAALEGYDPTATDDRDALTGEYDVLVDYRTDSSLTDDRLDALASVTTSKRSSSSASASAMSGSRPTTRTRTVSMVVGVGTGGWNLFGTDCRFRYPQSPRHLGRERRQSLGVTSGR